LAKRVTLVAGVLIVVAVLALVADKTIVRPNRLIVRNSSGKALDDVHLNIRSKNGHQAIQRDVLSLEPGCNVVVRHGMNDSSLDMVFSKSGKEYKHSEPYIDLWTGEGWVIEVQPDGTVTSGYESVRKVAVPHAPR